MPPELAADLRAIIAAMTWVFAKTMPENPHFYVVRGRPPENEAAYVRLFEAIHEHGQHEVYQRRRYRVLYLGDGFRYWAMTSRLSASRIINRAKV